MLPTTLERLFTSDIRYATRAEVREGVRKQVESLPLRVVHPDFDVLNWMVG